ncbi:arrestin domain-containing protein 5-like [Anticarsia gemmatalis]|uniref:arrestin domain-containing protein 5-like n=1 Tax=Anticarsia gemmatalis TaxID=129554 RepID=UPI003F76980A
MQQENSQTTNSNPVHNDLHNTEDVQFKMGIDCTIKLEKNKIYKSGDTVVGELKYVLDRDTKIEFIVLSLKGEGRSHWTGPSGIKCSATYFSSTEEYVNENIVIQDTITTVDKGTYKHPFEFVIPNNIPSSFKKKRCKIIYKIVAVFSKAVLGILDNTKTFVRIIEVRGTVKPCPTEPIKHEIPFRLKKEKIDLNIELEKSLVAPGEVLTLKCVVNNESSVAVKGIRAGLVRHTIIKMRNSKKKKSRSKALSLCEEQTGPAKCYDRTELTCYVPTPNINTFSIQHSKILEKSYTLNVTVRLPIPYRNVSFKIPVVIGEIVCDEEVTKVNKGTSWQFKLKAH